MLMKILLWLPGAEWFPTPSNRGPQDPVLRPAVFSHGLNFLGKDTGAVHIPFVRDEKTCEQTAFCQQRPSCSRGLSILTVTQVHCG